jgi:hypothetical protein
MRNGRERLCPETGDFMALALKMKKAHKCEPFFV